MKSRLKHSDLENLLEMIEDVRNRRLELLRRGLETAETKERALENLNRAIQEDLFIKRLVQDYSFCRYINKRVISRSQAKSHMRELGLIILTDLLYPGKVPLRRIGTVERKSGQDNYPGYETRTKARIIREYYPELFELLSREESYKKTRQSFKSILRSDERRDGSSLDYLTASAYLGILVHSFGSVEEGLHRNTRRTVIGTRISQGDPDEIRSLIEFNNGLKKSLGILRQNLGEPCEEGGWLLEQVSVNGPAVFVLHAIMLDSVRARWFRQRSSSSRMEILNRKCRLSYSEDDARKAVERNLTWFKDPDLMASRILMAAFGFADNDKHIPAIRLASACLPKVPSGSPYRSVAHRCLGLAYLVRSPRKALTEFRESEQGMLELGMVAEAAFDEGFMAESYMGLHKPKEAKREWKKCLDRLSSCGKSRTLDPRMLLMLVGAARRTRNSQIEQKLLELGFDASKHLEDPSFSIIFSRQMTDFLSAHR